MNRRGTGAVLILTAGILFSSRYIAAALFMSNITSWSYDLFQAGLGYIGSLPAVVSMILCIVGVFYLVFGEMDKGHTEKKDGDNQEE